MGIFCTEWYNVDMSKILRQIIAVLTSAVYYIGLPALVLYVIITIMQNEGIKLTMTLK